MPSDGVYGPQEQEQEQGQAHPSAAICAAVLMLLQITAHSDNVHLPLSAYGAHRFLVAGAYVLMSGPSPRQESGPRLGYACDRLTFFGQQGQIKCYVPALLLAGAGTRIKDVVFRVAPCSLVAVEGLCGGEVESVTVLSKVTGLF